MNRRLFRSLPAGFFALALFAISIAPTTAGNFAFAPPSGWMNVHSGTNGKWMDPTGVEVVTLHPTTFGGDLSTFALYTLKQGRASNPSQHVWTNKNYPLCGRHIGRFLIWTANNHGKSVIWEQMIALWGEDGYVVTYLRPASHAPNDIARASLVSICGVGSIPEQPGGVPVPLPRPPAQNQPAPEPPVAPTPNPTGTIYHPYVPTMPE
jgi:hypothetical protein